MEDDDYQDALGEQVINKVKERPQRLIKIEKHDGSVAFAEAVVEMAQVVLDMLPPGSSYKDVAATLKKKLDEDQKGTWHVLVGFHFGANVTHDAGTLVNFKVNEMHILVFRSGPPDRPLELAGENH